MTQYIQQGTNLVMGRKEVFQNLSMDSNSSQYAPNVINGGSQLITAVRNPAADVQLASLSAGWSQADTTNLIYPLSNDSRFIGIIVDGVGPVQVALFPDGATVNSLSKLVSVFQSQLNTSGLPVTVTSTGTNLILTSQATGVALEHSSVRVVNASSNDGARVLGLGLANRGREGGGAAGLRPGVTGTFGAEITETFPFTPTTQDLTMDVTNGTISLGSLSGVKLETIVGSLINSYNDLANNLQKALRDAAAADTTQAANPAFTLVTVKAIANHLVVVSGTDQTDAIIAFSGALAGTLGLTTGAENNVQRYSLGVGADSGEQKGAIAGNDGGQPGATDLIGTLADKSGIYALENVDIFNLLSIPRVTDLNDTDALSVISAAQAYCAGRWAFYIIDPPRNRNTVQQINDWQASKLNPDENSALYFPLVAVPDPLDGMRLNNFPPSGTLAGLYARTDSTRGVWKAPAGTDATLINVQGVAYSLTDAEVGTLNQIGVNCLRQLPVYGRVCWGRAHGWQRPAGFRLEVHPGSPSGALSWRRACIAARSGWSSNPTTSRSGRRSV